MESRKIISKVDILRSQFRRAQRHSNNMFEAIRIKFFGSQPAARVTDKILERLIERDFGSKALEVKQKLQRVTSDSHNGKNRISAAILKLSNKDFRDVISQAEYPRCSKLDFDKIEKRNMKAIYLDDWTEYSKWLTK